MNKKALETLEYSKILALLAERATSDPGRALCLALGPAASESSAEELLNETQCAMDRMRAKGGLSFAGVFDLSDTIERLKRGGLLSCAELLRLTSLLSAAARARDYGQADDGSFGEDALSYSFEMLSPLPALKNELSRCILSEDEVADSASEKLFSIRRRLSTFADRIHRRLQDILNSNRQYLQDGLITQRAGRYCLPVRAEYKSQIPGLLHGQSATGSTLFIEPAAVVELNNEYSLLISEEKEEVEAVLRHLTSLAGNDAAALKSDLKLLKNLDFIFARARFSQDQNATRPLFSKNRSINLINARHPLLNPATVVPTSLRLGGDFTTLVITGPNTGGKTVSMKTAALLSLMGLSGLFIPADEGSSITFFREIFTDIGDEQSIEQSLSTFSAHMKNIVSIIARANEYSLCLFDELCSGTDPSEGAALAEAILDHLKGKGALILATTHFSELKIYAINTPGVQNASCEFDTSTLSPTYRLIIGMPGKSNAFYIARRLGLLPSVIENAKERITSEEEAFEDIIARLEKSRQETDRLKEEAAVYKKDLEILKKRAAEKEKRLEERKEKILAQAEEKARQILDDAKATADSSIRSINRLKNMHSDDLKALEKERESIREGKKKLEKSVEKKMPAAPVHTPPKADKLRLGDSVFVHSMGLSGTVASLPDARGRLFVQMGILRTQVQLSDTELLPDEPKPAQATLRRTSSSFGKAATISPELNLLGMRTDEAVEAVDKYLDDAQLAHLGTVRIVHGKGTGALRAAIHRHLKSLPYVTSFKLAEYGEGDSGVTIVTL